MRVRFNLTLNVGLLLLMASVSPAQSAAPGSESPADIVIVGPVLTLDSARPRATGLVIKHGRITQVTDEAGARAEIGPNTRVIEVPPTGVAMPGIIDSHAHLRGVGQALRQLDLRGVTSPADAASRVAKACETMAEDSWVLGRGWSQELWEDKTFPNHQTLDAVCGGRPCALKRVDGHAMWVSSKTLALAGITSKTKSPPGGEILKDADGKLTGVLIDRAMTLVEKVMPRDDDPAEIGKDLLAAQAEAFRLGITTFVDAGSGRGVLLRMTELTQSELLKLRVYAMVSVRNEADLQAVMAGPPLKGLYNDRLSIRSIKLYADGALGSRGAWMLEPYADRAGHSGLKILEPAFIEKVATAALKRGYQVCTHAIGDRGCRETLDAYERAIAAAKVKGSDHRFRIEHAQILSKEDIPRFKELRVIPSMQGCHCTSDGPWVPDRVGQERASIGAYAWRSLIDSGVIIPNGTDAPVESLSPWPNLFSTITRFMPQPDGTQKAFFPHNRMNRYEALLSMTWWGAQGIFAEKERGVLRPGYQADVIVINRDPMKCSAWHLSRIGVLKTIVAGEVVYEKQSAQRN